MWLIVTDNPRQWQANIRVKCSGRDRDHARNGKRNAHYLWSTMTRGLRWLLVPVSAFVVWAATLLLGLAGVNVVDSFCPPQEMVSGACIAPWHQPAIEALIIVCAGLAAFGIVVVAALVAPVHKLRVAVVAFACGALFAGYLAQSGDAWGPFLSAGTGGSIGLWLVASRWR
jgi:hypothetical protein